MELVSTCVGLVGGQACAPIKRHLGYLIYYKRKIDNMEIKFGELDANRKDVQREVDAAVSERLEEVNSAVETWLENVKNVEEEVKRIKDQYEGSISTTTTSAAHANNNNNRGSFLHFCLHHRLGRQAAAQIQAIDDLLVRKGMFADRVSHSRPPPSTTGSLLVNYEGYVMFESRKSNINEILNALKDENVHMIGVYGMGGIGKTTLVKEAVKQAKNDGLFTEVVMVTVSQNLDVKRIQTGIAESLGLVLHEETVEVRADKIEGRLRKEGSRVLVVLDDLWETLELSRVRIPDQMYNGTCRVVITTRREDVCEQMECQKKVVLKTLSDEESWLLFKNRAGNYVVESPTMKGVAWNVAKQCAGLPLALVVLGTALKGKKLGIWETVLNQLKKSTMALDLPGVSNKVRQSIELSYNFLETEAAKSCFLHCCLYPEDYIIGEKHLMHMLVGGGLLEDVESLHEAHGRVLGLMDQLKTSGLLLEGTYHGNSYVRMHDVVRDVAIWIGERFFVRAGEGLEEWPRISDTKLQNCRRLSLMYNKIANLPSDPIKCLKLETLIMSNNEELSTIPENFFQHMGALKVLDLSHTNISCLPESLSCLTGLRVLNLRGCRKLQDISHINGLKMLEILYLNDINQVSVVPDQDTGGLLNLRLVHLGENSNTTLSSYFSNVLRGCSRLEQLFIPKYEVCLEELARLGFLTHLKIWGGVVDSNDSLSQDLGSSRRSWTNKLQEFIISFVPSGNYSCLLPLQRRSLHLTRTKLFSPLLKTLLEKIESLALVDCEESEVISSKCDIPPHVFQNLTELEVSGCLNLTSLGDIEVPLFQLKLMRVANCPNLARLFPYDDIHKPMAMTELLPKLEDLKLENLPGLESVLQPFQYLPNLVELHIEKCGLRCGLAYHEMEMATADSFPKLQILNIDKCSEMSQMISSSSPDALQGMCIFQNLTYLSVYECPRLTHLFWSKQAKQMQQLTSLEIGDCVSLTAVVTSNENQEEGASASTSASTCMVVDHHGSHSFFPRLTRLILQGLPKISAFHQPTALPMEWPCLKEHRIEGCPKLKETPLLGPQTLQRSRESNSSCDDEGTDSDPFEDEPADQGRA